MLHKALLAAGIDSQILGRVEADLPAECRATPVPLYQRLPVSALNRLYHWRLRRRFKLLPHGFFPLAYGLPLHQAAAFKRADIIHVQWSNASTFGGGLWRALRRDKRPVVWTLRDMWPFTGGCHFSGNCEKYVDGCGGCPLLGDNAEQMTANDVLFKRAHLPSNTTFIALSEHMATTARRSAVLRGKDIRVIANAVALPGTTIQRSEARRQLGLPGDKFLIAFGALNVLDPRKGADVFRAVVANFRDNAQVHIAMFGKYGEHLVKISPDNSTAFGLVKDEGVLQRIYAAADVFLMPSLQESFGKVTAEAMAAGTPVIAFDKTPAEEIIEHHVSGWLVRHGDTEAIITALHAAIAIGVVRLGEIGENARKSVAHRFNATDIAAKHIALYRELLGQRARPVVWGIGGDFCSSSKWFK